MKLKTNKRILGVFILLVIAMICPQVHAAACDPGNYDTAGRYGLKLDYSSKFEYNGSKIYSFILSMGSDNCDTTFDVLVDKINGTDYSVGNLSCGHSITISVAEGDLEYKSLSLPSLNVYLKSTSSVTDGSCTYDWIDADLSETPTLDPTIQHHTNPPGTITPIDVNQGNSINCAVASSDPFTQKFCNAKNKAGSSDAAPGSEHIFKCSTDITDAMLAEDGLQGEDYYINKNYLYHSEEKTLTGPAYEYHYDSCGTTTTSEGPSCTVTCEEAVEVEYGPPVASKAGMCFEYKVRVTSRTNCYMTAHSDPPPTEYSCCSPTPKCTAKSGKSYKQGGPSEDFDACVKRCDGGKYSKSCSNKCYKEVYGKAVSAAKMTNAFYDDMIASKMDITIATKDNFCYSNDGSITWSGEGGGTATWYATHTWGTSAHSTYIDDPYGNGIPRHNLGNGNFCQDECHWEGCSGAYLCPADQAADDYAANLEKYNNLMEGCNALSVCSTETAYVTISADYSTKKEPTVTTTITFPSSGKNSITHNASGTVTLPGEGDESVLLPNEPEDGQGILGCYKPGATDTNLYRLTWSFPGTWINSKSGEITYEPKGECTDTICKWQEQKNKFCVPNNAANVNQDWWNLYFNKLILQNGIETSITNSEVTDKCVTTTIGTVIQPSTSLSDIKYNIKAKTEKFGYYGWNIEMQCFYALNSTPLAQKTTSEDTIDEACKPGADNYRIRSIDLENVFPATNGDELSDPSSYGRTPGHNWTKYSDPATDSNKDYNNTGYFNSTAKPLEYLTRIQGAKDGIYDDDFEYEIYLSPRDIRNARKSSKAGSSGGNYTDFDESNFKLDSNGVIRYYSDLISQFDVHPAESARSCNNIAGHSGSCE